MKPYIFAIYQKVRKYRRAELRRLFLLGTGREVPKDANLRNFVAKWQAHQQAINGGADPSEFWRKAVGL